MFTGLIEEIGVVNAVTTREKGLEISIAAEVVNKDLQIDDSIAVDGICLTVVAAEEKLFTVQAVQETIEKTTLHTFTGGRRVNLERALLPTRRMGGHIVQGHVDDIVQVMEIRPSGDGKVLLIEVPVESIDYIVPKGSIALDGVSLTVAETRDNTITVWTIPHTLAQTTLGFCREGDYLNMEVDIIGKYVTHLLQQRGVLSQLSAQKMKEWGY